MSGPGLTCRVPWPACPNCYVGDVWGGKRTADGAAGWECHACGHRWEGPPIGAPCGRPPTHSAMDHTTSVLCCEAHAALAHKLLPHAEIKKLTVERKVFEL